MSDLHIVLNFFGNKKYSQNYFIDNIYEATRPFNLSFPTVSCRIVFTAPNEIRTHIAGVDEILWVVVSSLV